MSAGRDGGEGLDTLLTWGRARRPARVLDVASGHGDTALAFARIAPSVVACDATEAVLAAARVAQKAAAPGVRYAVGDVTALPFADGAFDVVTCRLAGHRFPEPAAALREARRVLRPAGALLLEDVLGHDDAEANGFMRDVARRRDPSHVKAYRVPEWKAFLRAAGLTIMDQTTLTVARVWADWTAGAGLRAGARADLERFVREAPERLRAAFAFRLGDTAVEGFTERTLLLSAERD